MASEDEPRLSIIPGWVATHPGIKGLKDLQVICVLGRNANRRHGWTRRSQVKIAEQLGCARSTVQASINRLVDIGAVERREVVSDSGRDSAHWYRVIYDAPPPSGFDFQSFDEDEEQEFGPIMDADDAVPPAGIPAPPAGPVSAPPAGPGPAPRLNTSCLNPPAEREREGEGEREQGRDDGQGGDADPRKLHRRVKAMELGTGGKAGPWPGAQGSSTDWATRQFASLTEAERATAEKCRDAYLADCERARVKPVALGVYFRDRKFEGIDPTIVSGPQRLPGGRIAVKVFGPAWALAALVPLMGKPAHIDLPADHRERVRAAFDALNARSPQSALRYLHGKGVGLGDDGNLYFPEYFERDELRRLRMTEGYPETRRLYEAKDRGHATVDARYEAMKGLMEAVPVDSKTYEAWRTFYAERFIPFPPVSKRMPVAFFPKGGPAAIDTFLTAVQAADNQATRKSDDAA